MQSFDTSSEDVFVISVFDRNNLLAILPCRLVTERVFGIHLRILEFPNYPVPIHDALIGPAESSVEIFQTITAQIQSLMASDWDYMRFRGVLEESVLVSLARTSPRSSTTHYDFSHLLSVTTDQYVETVLNAKARNNLRRNRKKLADRGEYQFRTFTTFPELEDAYQSFLETEAAGWKSVKGGKKAIALHEDQTAFYRDLLHRSSQSGRGHIHILYLNGKPIASDLCILTANSCYSLKHGYDEQYSNLAPGNLLREYAVEYYGRSSTIESIDLVSGMDWHLTWRPERRKVFDVRFHKKSLRGMLLYYIRRARRLSGSVR
ncbi:MAG: GNAT family N-acetyltransferase [Woeseiaceae bacterium]